MKREFTTDRWPLTPMRQPKRAPPRIPSQEELEYLARVRANKAEVARELRLKKKSAERAQSLANRKRVNENEGTHARMLGINLEALHERENERDKIENHRRWLKRIARAESKARAAALRRSFKQTIATPKWANKGAMLAVYRKAVQLAAETGIEHHVDHIVPLQARLVCGLHCEINLRPIPKRDNVSKGNRHWPDMPA